MRYLILSFLLISACASKDIPPFPTKEIHIMFEGQPGCYVSPIINDYPFLLGDPVKLESAECPKGVMGIAYEKEPEVRDWVKDIQDMAIKRCK